MQQPRNRQEFMRMQEQAVAAARDMQKRAQFKSPEPTPKAPVQRPKFREQSTGRRDGIHHKTPNRNQGPRFRAQGNVQQAQWQQPSKHRNCKRQSYYQPPQPPPPEPPPPPSPPVQTPPFAPGLSELFTLFGGMGGGNKTPPHNCESCDSADGGSMDSVLVILLMFLLQKEKADQGLMMALMYIMM